MNFKVNDCAVKMQSNIKKILHVVFVVLNGFNTIILKKEINISDSFTSIKNDFICLFSAEYLKIDTFNEITISSHCDFLDVNEA